MRQGAGEQARPRTAAFFIFDPSRTPEAQRPTEEEVADAKIIYYSPSWASPEEKRSQVGLLEGLLAFTAMFSGEQRKLQTIRTEQMVLTVQEVEPRTWMVLGVRHPESTGPDSGGQSPRVPDEEKLTDTALQAVLQNCYNVFRLLHGEIKPFVKDLQSMQKLHDLLEDFVPAFLETVYASDLGIFHEIDGFRYGAVERTNCASIHCFLSVLLEEFPSIKYSALLYNAHLIYTTLSLSDMKVLYSYLVVFNGSVSNHKLNRGPFGRIPTAASQPGGGSSSFGRAFLVAEDEQFLFGMTRGAGGKGPPSLFIPTVYLADGGIGKLVALLYHGIMLVLIFEETTQMDIRLLEAVRTACCRVSGDGLSLPELSPLISAQYAQVMERYQDEYRFIYYNHNNHALRLSSQPAASSRSLLGSSRSSQTASLKPSERLALCPLHTALADPRLRCREVSWKSADQGWICGKRWREREFYLLLDGNSMSLSKCQEECARFAGLHFSSLFMM